MRKNLGVKSFIYPQPVLIISTYDENGNIDVMNAAWGSVADYDKIFICLADDHQTTDNILKVKDFAISIGTKQYVVNEDYVGIVSLKKDSEKIKKSKFTFTKSNFINAPLINELPLSIECQLISYDKETNYLFAKIINVAADESILDDKNRILLDKLAPITYDPSNHAYHLIGEKVGNAFKDGIKLK